MTARPAAIHGVLRDYDWGQIDGLARWSGAYTGAPQAELWFGSHHAAPSPLTADTGRTLLEDWGDEPAPLLVKFLAAGSPLSLQVHPAAATIERWWHDPASAVLLSDQGEKTEMLIALEPFTVLVGWRDLTLSIDLLQRVGADQAVVAALRAGDRRAAIRLLLGDRTVAADAGTWADACGRSGLGEVARASMAAITRRFGSDPGVAVAALLRAELLAPGDGVFVPAGVPHAYVHGLGVEVMNSSDNVLRLGLTTKRMSVDQALEAIVDDRAPLLVTWPADGCYRVDGAPFLVRTFTGETSADRGRYRIVLPIDGSLEVGLGPDRISAGPGEAIVIPSTAPSATIHASGSAVVVSATKEAG